MISFRINVSLALLCGLGVYACTKTIPGDNLGSAGQGGQNGTAEGGLGNGGTDMLGAAGAPDAGAPSAGTANGGNANAGQAGEAGQGQAGQAGTGQAGGSGEGGGAQADCGAVGQACCGASACNGSLVCLAGATCSCAKALSSDYVIRTDGKLLSESGAAQLPVLDADTGLPLANVRDVQDGELHGCATLVASGNAWCWRTASGGNSNGQLGNGTTGGTGQLYSATRVLKAANEPLADVASIATGYSYNACAVTTDGKLFCWGDLANIANNGTSLSSGYAVPITSDGSTPLSGVLAVALGRSHACAIVQGVAAKEVKCWGYDRGNIGLGGAQVQFPTKIVGAINPEQLAITSVNGIYSTTCVRDGSNVRCWGYGSNQGSVGIPTVTGRSLATPTLVESSASTGSVLDGVVDIQAASSSNGEFCALRTDHTMWCWGGHYQAYAKNYGVPNVAEVGYPGDPKYLTSDGVFHVASTPRVLNCGAL